MRYFLFLSLFIFSISCKPTQSTNEAIDIKEPAPDTETVDLDEEIIELSMGCEKTATVQDNSGLDGCEYLIILDGGKRLEPLVVEDKSFKFRDGQKIRLTYQQEKEMMSICMAGQGVRITCIEEIK